MRDGDLRGVSLFDVSGHGIAPGLLTLLARSIIRHQFTAGENRRLGTVVENANRALVRELDAIENYLTGIVLRFTGNKVEYVNAGHTDLLLRFGATGSVIKVEPKGREFRGNFLGISALEKKFTTVLFSMSKGDTLLLFSDCLSETKNVDDEEYGVERIENSFKNVPDDADAKKIASYVLKDFYSFVDEKRIKDDMTFILVKRIADVNYQGDYSV
jgi:sigma-B regulation protein RsbU (phosphoserine phosphatase)